MCGRFAFYSPKEAVLAVFGVQFPFALTPHYNVAPTHVVAAIRGGADGAPEAARLRWGLVPFWAKDAAIGNRMINARAETLGEKPAFRNAWKKRRCVILANGFYEWQAGTGGRAKVPYYIAPADGQPIGLAGLWERWDKGGEPLETCTIITTVANSRLATIHERMPVILPPQALRDWVDPGAAPDVLGQLLRPAPDAALEPRPVSRAVNSPARDGPELIAAADG